MEMISQLVTESGTTYATDGPWPGRSDDSDLIVGPIFLLAGEEDYTFSESEGEEGGVELGSPTGNLSQPTRFEIWGMRKQHAATYHQVAAAMAQNPNQQQVSQQVAGALEALSQPDCIMIRRTIPWHQVASSDANWPFVVGYRKIAERMREAQVDSAPEGVDQTAGNGAAAAAQQVAGG